MAATDKTMDSERATSARPSSPNSSKYRRASSSLLLAALALVLLGGAILVELARNAESVARSQAVLTRGILEDLREVMRSTLDAETGQRGYLLTGERFYLEPYELGIADAPTALASLKERLASGATAEQQEALERMSSLLGEKLDLMRETVHLQFTGKHDEAVAIIRTGDGVRIMNEIRNIGAEIAGKEEAILNEAIQRAVAAERRAKWGFYGLGAAAVSLFAIGVWMSRRARAFEIDAQKSETNALLARELNHRIKNLFAVVSAIISLSSRGAKSPEESAARARDRIMALARAHEASQSYFGSESVDLEALLGVILEPYGAGSRATVRGPEATLPASFITPMGLLLHEWATNAAKYGALSSERGSLLVEWESTPAGGIVLTWTEAGGPGAENPGEEGFGTRLAEQSVRQMNAELDTQWKTSGVVRTMNLPLGNSDP